MKNKLAIIIMGITALVSISLMPVAVEAHGQEQTSKKIEESKDPNTQKYYIS